MTPDPHLTMRHGASRKAGILPRSYTNLGTWPIADLAAELRAMRSIPANEAADRLEELDAIVATALRVAHATGLFNGGASEGNATAGFVTWIENLREDSDRLEALDALRLTLTCPTCGGTGELPSTVACPITLPCPDCEDGHPSWADVVAVYARVWKFPRAERCADPSEHGEGWRACIDHLRSVRAEEGEQP